MASSVAVDRYAQRDEVIESVVVAVAETKRTDPLSLEPLYDEVDLGIFDELFEADRDGDDGSSSSVAFAYSGCDVVVSADRDVRVSKADREISKAK